MGDDETMGIMGMRRHTVARTAAMATLVLALAVAGCGDDGGSETSSDAGSDTGTEAPSSGAPPVSLEGRVNDHGSADLGSDTALDLELDDSYFAPTFVSGEPATTITVTLVNEGDAPHTFTIDAANIDEEVQPGASATVEVELPDDGSLTYYCRFHVGAGMQGAFVVSGNGSTTGASTSGSSSGGFGY